MRTRKAAAVGRSLVVPAEVGQTHGARNPGVGTRAARPAGTRNRESPRPEATMARETEKRAASVEAALEAALEELGISEQEGVVEVVQEAKSGFLGVGGQEAVVRVRTTSQGRPSGGRPEDRPEHRPEDLPEDLEEQADIAADFIEELLARMDIDAVAEPNARGDHMYVDIVDGPEDDMALLIGRHGQTLDAIQDLMRMAVGRRLDERIRVIVDVEDYRKRREAKLEERARELAQRVARGGTEEELEPMNAYERKLVHDAVAEIQGVESASRGEDPHRYVVIRKR